MVKRATSAIQLVLQQCCKTSCTFLLPVSRYHPESGKFLLVESGKKLESGILGFGILNLSKKIRNPKTTGIQNPSSTDKSRIHSVEARILDCPRFPYAGRDQ